MGYKAYMTFRSEPPSTNALVFATKEEAENYAIDLLSRWFVPTGYEVRESSDPVTDQWVDGKGLLKVGAPEGTEPHSL